jgi:hypothetical protein
MYVSDCDYAFRLVVYGKHTVWNVLYKISIIVAKVREVNILLQGTISDLLEDTIDKHENQKEGDDYE